ncbi:hypothetical protein GMRT_14409 [Giardia muris]|uniref:Uncharacterized protein n=1 Tax=Giardia muris TaxID=5742 RepID=A0A4Z1T542_GIAMU|nr:hypothetical protein GMRT_14409 [Giardia muris]|eukprot:TNJ27571.1 hypothetical protein GMRT_14409 [Giardia muris]
MPPYSAEHITATTVPELPIQRGDNPSIWDRCIRDYMAQADALADHRKVFSITVEELQRAWGCSQHSLELTLAELARRRFLVPLSLLACPRKGFLRSIGPEALEPTAEWVYLRRLEEYAGKAATFLFGVTKQRVLAPLRLRMLLGLAGLEDPILQPSVARLLDAYHRHLYPVYGERGVDCWLLAAR